MLGQLLTNEYYVSSALSGKFSSRGERPFIQCLQESHLDSCAHRDGLHELKQVSVLFVFDMLDLHRSRCARQHLPGVQDPEGVCETLKAGLRGQWCSLLSQEERLAAGFVVAQVYSSLILSDARNPLNAVQYNEDATPE